MLKNFKKFVATVAALGLLATSYVTVLAAPTTVIDLDMSASGSEKLFKWNGTKMASSTKSFTALLYGKAADDKAFTVPADSAHNPYFQRDNLTESLSVGDTVVLSADFAFSEDGSTLPQVNMAAVRASNSSSYTAFYVSNYSGIDTSVTAKVWHNICVVVPISTLAANQPNNFTVYIDGQQIQSGTYNVNGQNIVKIGYVQIYNKSAVEGNTMYLDNIRIDKYPQGETPTVTFNPVGSGAINFAMPYRFVRDNGASIYYPTGIYTKDSDDTVFQITGQSGKGSLVQIQDMTNFSNIGEGSRVEFSFDAALSEIIGANDLYITLMATPASGATNTFKDTNSVAQNYGLNFSNGMLEFYGKSTGQTVNAGQWYECKMVYDILGAKKVKATLYIDDEPIATEILTTEYTIAKVLYVRFSTYTGNTGYFDNVDIDISNFTIPSVSATADNQEQGGVKYMTWDAEPSVDTGYDVTDCGFAFINDEEITSGNPIVWQESTIRENGSFGAAIAQDSEATSSSIYAIPYIVGTGFAKLGTAVPSEFVTE
ncbi:MAG: hypothetical protein IJT23_08405 [Clostridia bacterium]|nr:hypothetical protein [Clostridia bacterium]